MEVKKFEDYTSEEQGALLLHWWNYYGKVPYSLAELEKFRELITEDSKLVKNIAVLSFVFEQSSQALIKAMRDGTLEDYLTGISKICDNNDFKEQLKEAENDFIEMLVRTYNCPEPSVPMSLEQVLESVSELVGMDIGSFRVVEVKDVFDDENILTAEKVIDTYKTCLLRDDEVRENASKELEPTVDFILGEGIATVSVFSAERLEENKKKIFSMLDELPDIDEEVSFLKICYDKNGRQWADLHSTMDLLVQLGRATGALEFTVPRDCWDVFPGGVPYVVRNRENDNEKIEGKKPVEFKKTVDEFRQNNS